MKPRVAVTLGDPRGIGPEIAAAVLADPPPGAVFVVIGPAELTSGIPGEKAEVGTTERLTDATPNTEYTAEEAGRVAGACVEKAAELALAGEVAAIVTAPVDKRALNLAGYRYPGLTEMLAQLAGGVENVMMLASDKLKVVLATTHLPLREAVTSLSTDRLVRVGEITRRSLVEQWCIPEPRLALCAVNPHAGEDGLFGSEDEDIVAPAARALAATGPLPADTVFVRAMRGEFDAVIAPYHDVGMTAIKVASFGEAVNVTLGLPFVRTSPDHGTAMDIAGKGVANSSSMRRAVALAIELVGRRVP